MSIFDLPRLPLAGRLSADREPMRARSNMPVYAGVAGPSRTRRRRVVSTLFGVETASFAH
jgi:hypothetical protein